MKTVLLSFTKQLNCSVFSCLSVTFTRFYFSYVNFITRPPPIRSHVTLCIVSCHLYCSLFACYYHFVLCLFIYGFCYLCRTIALVSTFTCWPYPMLNKFYLILSFYLINMACRPIIISWATVMEPYHLVKSLQVIWSRDIRGWTAMFVPGSLLLQEIGEAVIVIWTWKTIYVA